MQKVGKFHGRVLRVAVRFTLACASAITATAQQPGSTQGDSRGGTADGFVKASDVVRNRRPGRQAPARSYRTGRAFPDGPPPKDKTFLTVGITIGRGRLAAEAEVNDREVAKVEGCVQWEGKRCVARKDMVLARILDDDAVSDKEQIQMNIEYLASLDVAGNKQSNSVGYLYVINREQYSDSVADAGHPVLIFPTINTYGGDNRVLPGKTVTLPRPERPWTISRSDSGKVQAFETYIIIVSPEPLKDSSGVELYDELNLRKIMKNNQIVLDRTLVDGWVRQWGGRESRGNLEGGQGQLVTQREVKSSGDSKATKRSTGADEEDLKQDDPLPQIIYRQVVNPGGKMLVTIRLPFKEAVAPSQTQKQ